jgi:hypothetical protein
VNPDGTRDTGRWGASARGGNLGGTTSADMVTSSVEPTELSGFLETGESDSDKKSRLVRWREAEKGKFASSNTTC